jgi:hypothetical protein
MAVIPQDFGVLSANLAGCFPRSATTPGRRSGPVATRVEKEAALCDPSRYC